MSLREIKKSTKRFFSLCVLSFLGVSFFAGMKMSGPIMLASLDKYYDDNKVYDLKIVSTLGLVDEDVKEIKKLNKNYAVIGSHTKDALFNDGERDVVLRMHEINDDMNEIVLMKGRMPEKYNEIVVEEGIAFKTSFKIGDTIKLNLESNDTSIKTDKLKIVGIILSPEYLNNSHVTQSRGNTSLGNGQVAYYSYVSKDLFDLDYYTEIYILDSNAKKYTTTKEEYIEKIDKDIKTISTIKEKRQQDRYINVLNESNKKIKQEIEKANTELNKAQNKLEQYKLELDQGKTKLENAKSELDNAKQSLINANNEIQQGYKILDQYKVELSNSNERLITGKKEIEEKLKEISNNKITYDKLADFVKKYDNSSVTINDMIHLFNDDINIKEVLEESLVNVKTIAESHGIDLEELFKKYGIDETEFINRTDLKISEILNSITIDQVKKLIMDEDFIILVKESIPLDFTYYEEINEYLDDYINYKEDINKLFDGIRTIEKGYIEYNNSLNLISKNESELKKAKEQYENGLEKYNSGIQDYYYGMNEYENNLDLYNKSVKEFEENKKKVEEEIALAKAKIDNLEKPIWFIRTRKDNNEYITYESSYTSIDRLSNLFPLIFFIVSIMISQLSMARKAIEDRSEIGTLKALGFSNRDIRLKFIIYSLLATLIGGIIGGIVGYTIIPKIIIGVFNIMHIIPITIYNTNIMPIIIGIIISTLCIVGSTILTINNLVREKATTLLRPIAPPIGKEILLEKIPFIWDRINYSNKLTIRNIFRYKRRFFMSIFGIASCTMILLAGYGIKDSIAYVVDKQYNEINHNDALISLDGKQELDDLNKYPINEQLEFSVYAKIDQVEVENKRLSFIIPNDKDFKKAITLIDAKTKKEIKLKDNSVVITEKLAKYFNKNVGDTIKILENDNLTYEFTISDICENYIGDYIYMTKKTYIDKIGDYNINTQYLKYKNVNKEDEIISNLKNNNPHILSVVSIANVKKQTDILFKSLNIIIYVLVLFSGALSFVVFYSLAYINISERQREIATTKVLGFYNREVDNYIMKEEFIITILGILIGLVLGTIYTYQLIDSIEINTMQYIKGIHLDSYIQTVGFMIIFTIIVSVGVHFMLKKIDIIESLKSVE